MTYALKEWSVVCRAFERGLQTITLRKGGIEEEEGSFRPAHEAFFLYPTLEHQKIEALQPQFHPLYKEVEQQPQNSNKIVFNLWAECVEAWTVSTAESARALAELSIWSPEAMAARFALYPDKPLLLLVPRVYQLVTPLSLLEDP